MTLPKLIALGVVELLISISSTYAIGNYVVQKPKTIDVLAYTVNPEISITPILAKEDIKAEAAVAGARTEVEIKEKIKESKVPSITPTSTPIPTSAFGQLLSPTPIPTSTPEGTISLTPTPTVTPTLTVTPTTVPTLIPTITDSITPTASLSPSITITPTPTEPPSAFALLLSTPTSTITPTPTAVPTLIPTTVVEALPTQVLSGEETVRLVLSVSTMNQSKDKLRNPRDVNEINKIIEKVKNLNSTHVGVETPYDDPKSGDTDALGYTKAWVTSARNANLKVWHRHMPVGFEGIYDQPKGTDPYEYITQISDYIKTNKDLFEEGDIVTPIPEPQNAGVVGMNCGQNCMFESVNDFNLWLVTLVAETRGALSEIGLPEDKVRVVCCGFDGYVTWGNNNPDWKGKSFLYPETIEAIGHISIDHYPMDGDTMGEDIAEFKETWPGVELWISEAGSIPESTQNGLSVEMVTNMILEGMREHMDIIRGFQWFQIGPAMDEALIYEKDGEFYEEPHYDDVGLFYKLINQ